MIVNNLLKVVYLLGIFFSLNWFEKKPFKLFIYLFIRYEFWKISRKLNINNYVINQMIKFHVLWYKIMQKKYVYWSNSKKNSIWTKFFMHVKYMQNMQSNNYNLIIHIQ